MDKKVERATQAALQSFHRVTKHSVEDFDMRAKMVFNGEASFMAKVRAMDELFDNEPQLESLREVFFDLLMINFFAEDVKKLEEDYLESEEWTAIEEETIDRGTELLNLLLYLKECEDENIEPELEDYLKEFLLVDEDEFQDEHRIYEAVIANQILTDSSYEEIARVAGKVDESSEIKELFYPLMSFFHQPSPSPMEIDDYIANSEEPEFDAPVYALIVNYNKP